MNKELLEHYHGNQVRILFVIGGLIMIITYPFFSSLIFTPLPLSIIGCIALAVFGGLMNPQMKWVIALNTIIPVIAFPFFEYAAVYAYINLSPLESSNLAFFWANQVLSIIFFLAAYLSTRTLRASLLMEKGVNFL